MIQHPVVEEPGDKDEGGKEEKRVSIQSPACAGERLHINVWGLIFIGKAEKRQCGWSIKVLRTWGVTTTIVTVGVLLLLPFLFPYLKRIVTKNSDPHWQSAGSVHMQRPIRSTGGIMCFSCCCWAHSDRRWARRVAPSLARLRQPY